MEVPKLYRRRDYPSANPGIGTKTVTQAVSLDIGDMKPRVYDLQISAILNHLAPATEPESMLLRSQSLAKRHARSPSTVRDQGELRRRLEQWFSSIESCLFILQTGIRAEALAKIVLVNTIEQLRCSSCIVYFVLSESSGSEPAASLPDLLKSIVYQVLRSNPDFLAQRPHEISSVKYKAEHTAEEWLHLLSQVLSSLPLTYLLIDTSGLFQQIDGNGQQLQQVIDLFQSLVDRVNAAGKALKVLLVSYGSSVSTVTPQGSRMVYSLRQQVLPPKMQMKIRGRNQHRMW